MAAKISHDRQYGSIADFYKSVVNSINSPVYEGLKRDKASWFGLSNQDIETAKNGYTNGMELFNQMPEPDLFGGSKMEYRYNETDGDDLNIDRFLDGLPALKKRTRVSGNNSGRFVDLHINVAEHYLIDFAQMLYKTFAAVKIIDHLESQNIRVAVYVVCAAKLAVKSSPLDVVTIKIKDYNEPVIIPLLLNAISPWFFRKYILMEISGKIKVSDSIGHPCQIPNKNTDNIYIETGQCLNLPDAITFINNLNLN